MTSERDEAMAAFDESAPTRCTGCSGRGTVPSRLIRIRHSDGLVIYGPEEPYPCPLCHGTGIEACEYCGGAGLIDGEACPYCVPPRSRMS